MPSKYEWRETRTGRRFVRVADVPEPTPAVKVAKPVAKAAPKPKPEPLTLEVPASEPEGTPDE